MDNVRCSPNKSEQTSIFFSRNPDQIKIDFKNLKPIAQARIHQSQADMQTQQKVPC